MRGAGRLSPLPPAAGDCRRARAAGFTFAEVLASMMFVAIVIPVCLHGIALANKVETIAARKAIAVMLAERVLNHCVVTQPWQSGSRKGDGGTEWPGYRWTVTTQTWTKDTMRRIMVTVYFWVQDQEYSVWLNTLVEESTVEESTAS